MLQETQVTCAPNAWTSLAPLMARRRMLRVQCPQLPYTDIFTVFGIPVGGGPNPMVTANALRKTLVLSASITTPTWLMVTCRPTGVGLTPGQIALCYSEERWVIPPLVVDDSWGDLAQAAWFGLNSGPSASEGIECHEVIHQCKAIILSTHQGAGSASIQPPGHWLGADFSAGPAYFQTQRDTDGELTTQEWFCWVVGSVPVNVPIWQVFDDPPQVAETFGTFNIAMPALSPYAKAEAARIIDLARKNAESSDV